MMKCAIAINAGEKRRRISSEKDKDLKTGVI